jgi:hypothetical protein
MSIVRSLGTARHFATTALQSRHICVVYQDGCPRVSWRPLESCRWPPNFSKESVNTAQRLQAINRKFLLRKIFKNWFQNFWGKHAFMYIFVVDVQYMTEGRMWHVAWLRYCFGRWQQYTKRYKNINKCVVVAQHMKTGRLFETGRWHVM